MNNQRIGQAVILGAVLLAAPVLAQGSLEGSWKLAVGKSMPCQVSMTADGGVTPATDCPSEIARWKGTSDGVQLQTASGETYAVLKPQGQAFQGATIADMRRITLSR